MSLIRAKDIKFCNGFISVFIVKSKADQLREGQLVIIAESGSSLFLVALLKLYINSFHLSLDSDEYIFRPFSASTVLNVCFPLMSLYAIPLTGSLSRNLFVTLCQILLTLVLTPQDQMELFLLRILEFLKEISSAMVVGLQFRPKILIFETLKLLD